MNQDEEHLRLLSIFHYVCALVAALVASVFLFHLVFGLVMALRPEVFGPGTNRPPAFMGWMMATMGGAALSCGWLFAILLAWAGRCLARRKHYTFCLVMGGVACLFMPFGTVLGVFTILLLIRPSVKALFGPQPRPAG